MDRRHPLLTAAFVGLLLPALAQHGHPGAPREVGSLTRSDSLDLLHTLIELDLSQTGNGLIAGHAAIRFVPKVNGITELPLDLLQLTVDSVSREGSPLAFTHVGEDLRIALGGSYGPADTATVDVYYHGDPVVDASGWGGFYTLSTYQYDLGVAFDAVPHSFGRAWFPCFDNFVERCTFDLIVRTTADRTVFANGSLVGITDLGGGVHETHWHLAEPIPSYLASVASTNYVAVRDTFPSVSGDQVPVTLVARPQDTTDMKASFIHLRNAFNTYEHWFGPYRWERVGFVLTSQGAMEHPTNVCYPDFAADGTLTEERLYAHELSHHWFGDLITCHRPEEMYINEGSAEFCSYLFMEDLYGRASYDDLVRTNHHNMVSRAHLLDHGWYALNNIPQDVTYGEDSYRKGLDMWRSLRSILGDDLYRSSFTRVLTNDAFSDMSSEELRDSLSAASGQDLTAFFDNWVFQPGWSAFEVDSMNAVPNGGQWHTTTYVQQKLDHADHLYSQVPLTITYEAADGTRWTDPVVHVVSGELSAITSEVPFQAAFAFANGDDRLALATTVQEDTLTHPVTLSLPLADLQLVVDSMPASAPIRVEEFWTPADDDADDAFAYRISPDRWWRITGHLPEGAAISARFTVDGRATSTTSYDPGLVQDFGSVPFMEDSLVLLYRPNPHFPWSLRPNVSINFLGSNHSDGYARLTVEDIDLGDYTYAWRKSAVGIDAHADLLNGWRCYPSPTDGSVTVEAPANVHHVRIIARDAQGRRVAEQVMDGDRAQLDLRHLATGIVYLSAVLPNGTVLAVGRTILAR